MKNIDECCIIRVGGANKGRSKTDKVVKGEMEEAKGIVKHIVLGKFKDDISPERIEELIKSYANLVNLIPPMKSFHWYTTFYPFSPLCVFVFLILSNPCHLFS